MDEENSRREARTRANKLFVGNLPFSVTNRDLESTFSAFGEIIGVKLVEDRSTRRFRGFGFVNTEESGPDIFVHMEVFRNAGIEVLVPGQFIMVRYGRGPKGLMAADVKRIDSATSVQIDDLDADAEGNGCSQS